MERKEIFNNDYMGLFNDGTIGVSDGVGFVGSLDEEDTKELYNALKKYYAKNNHGKK